MFSFDLSLTLLPFPSASIAIDSPQAGPSRLFQQPSLIEEAEHTTMLEGVAFGEDYDDNDDYDDDVDWTLNDPMTPPVPPENLQEELKCR